jgi:hypothetical protein
MVRENTYRLVGSQGIRTLWLLGGTVYNNGHERGDDFVSDPKLFLEKWGYHFLYNLDSRWTVYEKRFGPHDAINIRFSTKDAKKDAKVSRDIEVRGIEETVHTAKWELGLVIE